MKTKTYWLSVNSWHLIESFTTESISPHSFYESRYFGNQLSRHINCGYELTSYLLLYDKQPNGDYLIELTEDIVNKSLLLKTEVKGIYSYPKTIYYKKGCVKYYFSDKKNISAFVAETKILFEVKCVEKYLGSFCEKGINEFNSFSNVHINNSMSLYKDEYVSFDNKFNFIKGAIVGYIRGQMTSKTSVQYCLGKDLINLKNRFAGLNTQLMINDDSVCDMSILDDINKLSKEIKAIYNTNTDFDVISHIFTDMFKLSHLRKREIEEQKIGKQNQIDLKGQIKLLQEKKLIIEDESNISALVDELNSIKQLECRNGKKEGRSRKYFKKYSPEWLRKTELKANIENFRNENKQYADLIYKIVSLKNELLNLESGSTKYDNALASLFFKVSDILNRIIKDFSDAENKDFNLNFSAFIINDNLQLSINDSSEDPSSLCFLNILLEELWLNAITNVKLYDSNLINLIEKTCRKFELVDQSDSSNKQKIIDCLNEYLKYKNNMTETFSIPDGLPILEAVMTFFIKLQGFDQIERFMQNRNYYKKEYAFLLWAASVGFASIPKTFTSILYIHSEIEKSVESFLYSNCLLVNDNYKY